MTALNKKARIQLKAISAMVKSMFSQSVSLPVPSLNLISAFIIVGDMEKLSTTHHHQCILTVSFG